MFFHQKSAILVMALGLLTFNSLDKTYATLCSKCKYLLMQIKGLIDWFCPSMAVFLILIAY